MYEVEVKVPAEHDAVRTALAEGTVAGETPAPAETVAQADTYYDAPHRNFAETDEAFRVRRVATAAPGFERSDDLIGDIDRVLDGEAAASSESRVTYKGPLVEAASKTREEFETTVGDGDEVRDIVERLGFDAAATVRKLRTRYAVGDLTVLLDAVEDVGEYVEVETEVETEAEVEVARERAYRVLRALKLDPDDQIRTSYLGLKLGVDEHDGDA